MTLVEFGFSNYVIWVWAGGNILVDYTYLEIF